MRLADCVELVANNEDCAILKVKPNMFMELCCLGWFDGDETMFRLTKGDNVTCTVWKKDENSYSWDWGRSGGTIVSDKMKMQGKLILNCLKDDFNTICLR